MTKKTKGHIMAILVVIGLLAVAVFIWEVLAWILGGNGEVFVFLFLVGLVFGMAGACRNYRIPPGV